MYDTLGSGHNYLREEKKYVDYLFNFCSLVASLVGHGFPPFVKTLAQKSFDVDQNYIKDLPNKNPVSNVLLIIE